MVEGMRFTELANKVCPRLCDSASWRSGEITQPRTNFFGQLCIKVEGMRFTELANKVCPSRLRDSACWRCGEITQPRKNFFGQLCTFKL